jgi:hypothetical protein
VRGAVGALLLVAAIVFWVRRRDAWRAAFRTFMDEGRNYSRTPPTASSGR